MLIFFRRFSSVLLSSQRGFFAVRRMPGVLYEKRDKMPQINT